MPNVVLASETPRSERIQQLQRQAVELGQEVVTEWLAQQSQMLRACHDVLDCGDAVPQGIREQARLLLTNLESENLTNIQLVGRLYGSSQT